MNVNAPASGATDLGPPTIFLSYSHKDEGWKDRLLAHLGIAAEEGLLAVWNDRQIGAGADWLQKIQEAIEAARVAVFLISANFLTSRFIRGTEVPQFLKRRATEGLQIFPVIVRSCDWEVVPWLSPLQARPRDGKALAGFGGDRIDAELAAISKEIRAMLRSDTPQVSMQVPQAPRSRPPRPASGIAQPDTTDSLPLHEAWAFELQRPHMTQLGIAPGSAESEATGLSLEQQPGIEKVESNRPVALALRWFRHLPTPIVYASRVLGALAILAAGGLAVARSYFGWPRQIDPAIYNEAMRWYDGEAGFLDEARARQLVEGAARQGDKLAKMWKARSLYGGRMGYPKDEAQGQNLASSVVTAVERRANTGDALAAWLWGEALKDGIGVMHDQSEAAKWLAKACTGGRILVACANLGNLYATGQGVLPDPARAAALYGFACDGGDLAGCSLQGVAYDLGSGVAQDKSRAERLYDRACRGKVFPACVKQGSLLQTDNPEKAIELYRRACDADVPTGCTHLSAMTDMVQEDTNTAILRAFWMPDGHKTNPINQTKLLAAMKRAGVEDGVSIALFLNAAKYDGARATAVQDLNLKK
jgi:TPR repeat protein